MRIRLVVLIVLLLRPVPLGAHTLGREFVPLFDGTQPPHPDVVLEPSATGAMPHVGLRVSSAHTVEVTGPLGEPFVRVGPQGAFVNVAAPSAALLDEQAKLPSQHVAAEPRWVRRSSARSISWYEPRAEYPYNAAPDVVRKKGKRATIHRWSIPATYDGEPMELRGHVDWVPQAFDPTSLVLVGLSAAGVLYVFIGGRLRARRAAA